MNNAKEIKKEIGAQLKAARGYRGITQRDLVKLAGISETTINHYERGDIKNVDKIIKLANVLGASVTIKITLPEA